jgi:hypothetical protein
MSSNAPSNVPGSPGRRAVPSTATMTGRGWPATVTSTSMPVSPERRVR